VETIDVLKEPLYSGSKLHQRDLNPFWVSSC